MNLYNRLRALFPDPPLQVGDVTSYSDGIAWITLPGGGVIQARGEAAPGDRVFVRDGLIEGPAPDLPIEVISI